MSGTSEKSGKINNPNLFFVFVDLKLGKQDLPDFWVVPSLYVFSTFDNPYFKSGKKRWRWHRKIGEIEQYMNNWDILRKHMEKPHSRRLPGTRTRFPRRNTVTSQPTQSPERLPPIHPGQILNEEFLQPMNITQYRLAKAIGVDARRIHSIVHGERAVTPETALLLSRYFGNSAGFWMGLQSQYDLEIAEERLSQRLRG